MLSTINDRYLEADYAQVSSSTNRRKGRELLTETLPLRLFIGKRSDSRVNRNDRHRRSTILVISAKDNAGLVAFSRPTSAP